VQAIERLAGMSLTTRATDGILRLSRSHDSEAERVLSILRRLISLDESGKANGLVNAS
jgi:hypothetical protein